MLTATGSITINKPVADVWDMLTEPNVAKDWVGEGTIESNWEAGDLVTTRNEDGSEYTRGEVLVAEPHEALSFTLYDAFEADELEDDEEGDIHVDTWTFTFEEDGNTTLLTMNCGDYDDEHDSDDAHDHDSQVGAVADMNERIIPAMLSAIKELSEQA